MHLRFAQQLLLSFIAIIAVTLITATATTWQAAQQNVKRNAANNLRIAESVFKQQLNANFAQISSRARVLADDFGFRSAIATGERETINSVLINHGERVAADMMFVLSPDGSIIASTHELGGISSLLPDLHGTAEADYLTIAEGEAFQVVLVPVFAPDLIAWAGMGFVISDRFVNSLREMVLADITLIGDKNGHASVIASTLDASLLSGIDGLEVGGALDRLKTRIQENDMLGQETSMSDTGGTAIRAVLSVSLAEALAAFQPLRNELLLIAIGCLLLALVGALLLARGVTRPIATLLRAALRIGQGDYKEPVVLATGNEFEVLAGAINEMQEDIQGREEIIRLQANFDRLTQLPNRLYLGELIDQRRFNEGPGDEHHFGILLIRISNLHRLNDAYGAKWCDDLLPLIAKRLHGVQRRGDHIGKVARDQFALYCDELSAEGVSAITCKIINAMQDHFIVDGVDIKIDAQIGVALFPEHGTAYVDLLRRAHIALGHVTGGGSGKAFRVYETGEDERHRRQIQVTNRLQRAIFGDNDGLTLHYQPKLDLASNRVSQAEALLRWTDDELGPVYPDEFIPLAESSGNIRMLTDWVLNQAVRQAVAWRTDGIPIAVGVNLSAHDFLRDDFVTHLARICESHGAEPSDLVLEITESATIFDVERSISYMDDLRGRGFKLSMDDFGTGYSSLSQLKLLPLDELKIDKSFVLALDSSKEDRQIVKSTIELGHNLEMRVVAEGVENDASLAILKQMGCDAVQGYFLSKPMPANKFVLWWHEFKNQSTQGVAVA